MDEKGRKYKGIGQIVHQPFKNLDIHYTLTLTGGMRKISTGTLLLVEFRTCTDFYLLVDFGDTRYHRHSKEFWVFGCTDDG
jgi:hypothetical protein